VEKAEGQRPLTRLRHRWEDIANADAEVIDCEDVGWVYVPQKRDN
jgi:hypothetical protein